MIFFKSWRSWFKFQRGTFPKSTSPDEKICSKCLVQHLGSVKSFWVVPLKLFSWARPTTLSTCKTPSTRSRVFSKTKTVFSEYGYHPHVTGVFGHRKRRFSNTVLQSGEFWKWSLIYRIRVDGRKRRFSNTMTSCLYRFKARSSAYTIRKRYVWTQIFLNTEDKVFVSVWTRPKLVHVVYMYVPVFQETVNETS